MSLDCAFLFFILFSCPCSFALSEISKKKPLQILVGQTLHITHTPSRCKRIMMRARVQLMLPRDCCCLRTYLFIHDRLV